MSLLTFEPVYQKRIWGGRNLETELGRTLPADAKIGESWELVDRPEACSRVSSGAEPGATLHDIWEKRRKEIFGKDAPDTPRFPILIKLLDCVDTLSVQVHPPADKAKQLHGEPKTEMWYFVRTTENASVYAGLKRGVCKEDFRNAIGKPELAGLLHKIATRPAEALFLPSGRVHAIGGGNLILEVQQNSDTTYRVDDWGRVGDDGKPRELHIEQAMESINFNDFEPFFIQPHGERILECSYFSVRRSVIFPDEQRSWHSDGSSFQYHMVVQGEITIEGTTLKAGMSCMVSADHLNYDLNPGAEGVELVTVQWGIR